ncbi:MAG TPA: hypothetical protein VIF62_12590 [Labilithrix sp.]|jgi:hypothetical protein
MKRAPRVFLLVVVAAAAAVALAIRPPIPQPVDYHAFADARTMYRIPNALNVLSNVPFAIVGWLGLAFLARAQPRTAFASYRERPAYVLFFVGVFLTAFGSSYYHLAPSTERLFWDRLPMSIAFMALFATVIAERIDVYWSRVLLLPLVFTGVASVVLWRLSEQAGHGDLRAYLFVQLFPMLALPMMMMLFEPHYTHSRELVVVVLLYACAKALEHFDVQVWNALDHKVSGHSLKHVVAALATYFVLDMLKRRAPRGDEDEAALEPSEEVDSA